MASNLPATPRDSDEPSTPKEATPARPPPQAAVTKPPYAVNKVANIATTPAESQQQKSFQQRKSIAPWKTEEEMEAEEATPSVSKKSLQQRKSIAPWKTEEEMEAEEATPSVSKKNLQQRKSIAPWKTEEEMEAEEATPSVSKKNLQQRKSIAPWKTEEEMEAEEATLTVPKKSLQQRKSIAPWKTQEDFQAEENSDESSTPKGATPTRPPPQAAVTKPPFAVNKVANITTTPAESQQQKSFQQRKSIAPWKTEEEMEAEEATPSVSKKSLQQRKSIAPWKTEEDFQADENSKKKAWSPSEKQTFKKSASVIAPWDEPSAEHLKTKAANAKESASGGRVDAKQNGNVPTKNKTSSSADVALQTSLRSKSYVIRFVSLIDDGFENPDATVIRQRMETLLLIGAILFSMVTTLMGAVNPSDFAATLEVSNLNHTVQELATLDLTHGHYYYKDFLKYIVSDRVTNYIEFARENQDTLETFATSRDFKNVFYMEKVRYQESVINAEISVLMSFFATGVCFFTFNHTRTKSFAALRSWYRWSAIFLYASLYLLLTSIGFFNIALQSSMFFKSPVVSVWIDYVLLTEFVHLIPGPTMVFVAFIGMLAANWNARKGPAMAIKQKPSSIAPA